MKITIATGPIFPVPTIRGGAAQRVWEGLIPEFVKRGHEVTVFAREFPGQPNKETANGIRYLRRGGYEQSTSIKRDLVQCLIYALKVAQHVPPGDVVVTNDFWLPAVLPHLNRRAGKVVASIARFPKRQFFLYAKCAAIAPVSESVADGIRRQTPGIAQKITVVPNCVDAAFLVPETLRQAKSVTRILFVGRIHPEKGLLLLANALRLLAAADKKTKTLKDQETSWECVLVGPLKQSEGGGGENFVQDLKRELAGLPVRFEPAIYNVSALAKVYDEGDILVYPSIAEKGEAMPLAPLEGMARGLVPVVSDIAAFREYLDPKKNGLVFDHRGPDAGINLARALQDLVSNPAKRAAMSVASRETAERFSPAVIADKYLHLFSKVISGSH